LDVSTIDRQVEHSWLGARAGSNWPVELTRRDMNGNTYDRLRSSDIIEIPVTRHVAVATKRRPTLQKELKREQQG
jgi:hypothetical protein